jgi:uncharacterized membrane protein
VRQILNLFILLIILLAPSVARADMDFCNLTSRRIRFAFGTEEWYSGALCHVGNETRDEIIGWYVVNPGKCFTPEIGCLCNWWASLWGNCPGEVLHVYAETVKSPHRWWGGNQPWKTCTPWARFDECDHPERPCPKGKARLLPWGMQFYGVGPVCNITVVFL